jgi:hypothetical protein
VKHEINLNDHVEVVLNARGVEIYNAYERRFEGLYEGQVMRYKAEGDVLRDSLWHIMQIFGEHIYMGCVVPFEGCKVVWEGKA